MPEKPKKGTRKLREPQSAEIALWQEVVKDVKSLKKKKIQLPTEEPPRPSAKSSTRIITKTAKAAPTTILTIEPRLKPQPSISEDISAKQMSAAQRKKLERGDLPIDGRIDLHGMTSTTAHDKLINFITKHVKLGSRCLLVITGKGARDETGRGQGVLRKNLPNWLDAPDIRPHILSLTAAAAQHGGTGAFYLYLRRAKLR